MHAATHRRPSKALRTGALIAAIAAGLAACGGAQPPAPAAPAPAAAPVAEVARPAKTYRIEDFIETVGVAGSAFNADESRILFSSNKTGIWNVYAMPAGGGEWTQLTKSSTDNNYAVDYFPADDRVLITRDQGGNELNHLYVIEADGSERDLTPGENLKADFAGFTPDGSAFHVIHNGRDAKFFDVYRYDAKTYEATRIFENKDGYEPAFVSDDGKWLALGKSNTTNDSDLFVAELATGKVTKVSEHTGQAQFNAADFSPDSQHLYYTANDAGEFAELRRVNLATWAHEPVQKADWDIAFSYFSDKGKYRVVGINEDGSTKVRMYEASSGAEVPLPALPAGEVRGVNIARSEKKMAFYLNGDRQPSDLYVLEFGGEPKQLTTVAQPGDRPGRPGRLLGRALQELRRDGDPQHPVQAAPGHRAGQGAGAGVGAWRPGRADHARAQLRHPVPGQPRLRGAGHQQPRQLRLRQDLLRRG